jgi:hypothetical protein
MKNIKILTILLILMGFSTVYSQQTSTELQKDDQQIKSGQVDRSTLSPNPAPGDLILETVNAASTDSQSAEQKKADKTDPLTGEVFPSPNPANIPGQTNQIIISSPPAGKAENPGPRPSDPNAVRPETK